MTAKKKGLLDLLIEQEVARAEQLEAQIEVEVALFESESVADAIARRQQVDPFNTTTISKKAEPLEVAPDAEDDIPAEQTEPLPPGEPTTPVPLDLPTPAAPIATAPELPAPDMVKYDEMFDKAAAVWQKEINDLTRQLTSRTSESLDRIKTNDFRDAAGGSTVLLDNDDVVFKQRADVVDMEILAFNAGENKFVSERIQTVIGGGANNTPLFIQNSAPVTTEDKYMWIQTAVNGVAEDMTFWVEDGF